MSKRSSWLLWLLALGVAWPLLRRAPSLAEPSAPVLLRYVAVGGGIGPASTEISLEQNIALATTVFPGPGRTLFAGGAEAECVRSIDTSIDRTSALAKLGKLFAPHAGRTSRYHKPDLTAEPATRSRVEHVLGDALSEGDAPLLFYVVAHGERGEKPRDNDFVTWGGEPISVARLADISSAHARQLRVVIATCYSGGFAELAFEGADPRHGVTQTPRCGLFAGTWDRQASGCDPDASRRLQENYSLHLLHALRGEDRDGKPLPKREVDFDGDGVITLLEAHTRARIASASIDVPTSTSERFLREVQRLPGPIAPSLLPEDAAVVEQLGAKLGLRSLEATKARLTELDTSLDDLDKKRDAAAAELRGRRAVFGNQLLSRWPVIDDAFHPDFAATLERNELAIAQAFEQSDAGKAYSTMSNRVDKLDVQYAGVQTQEAGVTRLLRAYETLGLVSALAKRGGKAYADYRQLLACERAPL